MTKINIYKNINLTVLILALLYTSGCQTSNTGQLVTTATDTSQRLMALEYRDFEQAAHNSVSKMLLSGAVENPKGGRYVLAISRISNDTMQRIDTDLLVKKIRVELLNSGKVVVSNAIGLNGAEDPMVMKARQLRKSQEFNQGNVAKKASLVAPDLSLSGKIIQRNLEVNSRKNRVEYYFQLSLTDLNSGVALWETEEPIIKEGGKAPIW